jgi:hypothetical protein
MQSNVNKLSVRTARAINHKNVEQHVDTKGQRPLRPFTACCLSYLTHYLQNVTTSLIAVTKQGIFSKHNLNITQI